MAASLFDNLNLSSGLDTFKKNTANAMGTVKDAVLTPISAVKTKTEEGIAFVKKTDSQLQSVISSYKSVAVEQLDGILGALSGGLLNTSDLTKMVRVGPNGVTFNTDDLVANVGNKIGIDISGGQSGFMNRFANTLNSEFGSLTSGYVGNLVSTDGKTFSFNKNWRGQSGAALLNILGRYADVDELIDVSVTNSFYNTLLYNSAQYGMSGSYAGIASKYLYRQDATSALINAVSYMLSNGDVESLNEVMTLLDKDGVMSVNAKYPQFVENLLSKFTFAPNVTADMYPDIRAKLLGVLVGFAGPEWFYVYTQFGRAYDLGITSQISTSVITLLSDDETYAPLLYTTGMFQDESAISVLRTAFPDTPLLSSSM